jgi:DNA-binding response OmpR family regulator
MSILLVDDDMMIASGLRYALEQEGYSVTCCGSVAAAWAALARATFDLAILDLGLPDGTGFDVCRTLQEKNDAVAVIFLTATDDEANTVRGFDLGADDYIAKPFRLRELLARVKAVLRRRADGNGDILTLDGVSINTKAAKVTVQGDEIELTALEYRLLLSFALNRGQVLTRAQLLESLWDTAGSFVNDNTLTVYIKRLREKLGDNVIRTVRGVGYRA